MFRLRRGRRIQFAASNGVCIVMYRSIYEQLRRDPRLTIYHTAYLSHSRQHATDDLQAIIDLFRENDIHDGIRSYRRARFSPMDLFVSPTFSERLQPKLARLKIQIFHGVSFKNCAVSPKTFRFDRMFLPGEYHRRRFIERGLYEEGDPRLVMIGLPKLDRLVDGSIDRAAVLSRMHLDPARKTVLYAPTGDVGNSLYRQGESLISALLDLPVNVIVKPHDHASPDPKCTIDWRTRLETWKHERLRVDFGSDVVPLLAIADLLVTDASSVAFEYALLDRPIVFVDVPEILSGPRFASLDLDTWGRKGGDVVADAEELRRVVPRLLEDASEKSAIRRAIAEDLFFRPGTATTRAVRRLYDEMELDPPEALRSVQAAAVG